MSEQLLPQFDDQPEAKLSPVTEARIEATLETFGQTVGVIAQEGIRDAVGCELQIAGEYQAGACLLAITPDAWGYFAGATLDTLQPRVVWTGKDFFAEPGYDPDHPKYAGFTGLLQDYLRGKPNVSETLVSRL